MIDLAIVGGGLAGSILGLFIKEKHPEITFKIFEKHIGPSEYRTWSLHEYDVLGHDWVRQFFSKSWQSYRVIFPEFERYISSPYHSIKSDELRQKCQKRLSEEWVPDSEVRTIEPHGAGFRVGCASAEVSKQSSYDVRVVIDASGVQPGQVGASGYQKFVGCEVKLRSPHGLVSPLIMDSRCSQKEGYRFFYCLPWDEKTLLVEDTYYSLDPQLDADACVGKIRNYVAEQGWSADSIVKKEQGILPIPFRTSTVSGLNSSDFIPRVGMRGGFFNPTTGYSLPDLLRITEVIGELIEQGKFTAPSLIQALDQYRASRERLNRYYCFLNRMLFHAASPEKRYLVLARFYRLRAPLIERFYSGELKFFDRLRILAGKPPVPVLSAMKQLMLPRS